MHVCVHCATCACRCELGHPTFGTGATSPSDAALQRRSAPVIVATTTSLTAYIHYDLHPHDKLYSYIHRLISLRLSLQLYTYCKKRSALLSAGPCWGDPSALGRRGLASRPPSPTLPTRALLRLLRLRLILLLSSLHPRPSPFPPALSSLSLSNT